ncbi:MAG: hypothetical protein RMK31_06825 [Candidatus Caldarchaeum sp.]|nr:hypothetical protein [Candidatus Caldarchaeum sp.]
MKISPLKRLVSVVPETTLDLLNVYRVVEAGDLVYSLTSRELKKERRDGSFDSERVVVELGVEVLEKRLDPMVKRVDFHGVVRYESRELGFMGKHHSIHLGVGDEITVESRRNYPRLEAMASYYRGAPLKKNVAVVLVDDEGLTVYDASPTGFKLVLQKTVSSRKMDPEERAKTIQKAYDEAVEKTKKAEELYVFGPSVAVDEFVNHVKRTNRETSARIRKTGYVSTTGFGGVSEILRNKTLHELRESVKAIADAEEVEELLENLAKDPSKVALGVDESYTAFGMKAVEKILFAEDFLWSSMADERVEQMLEKADSYRVDVRVVSSGSEASDKLMSLGGVACILRYSVEPSLLREGR